MTTCGGIPETGTAPLGGRFLLVTDAQENGWERTQKGNVSFHNSTAMKNKGYILRELALEI